MIVIAANKNGNTRGKREVANKRRWVNGKMETKYKLKQRNFGSFCEYRSTDYVIQ